LIASTPGNLDPPDLVNAGFARRLIALVYEALIAVALTLVAATPFVMIAGEPSGSLPKMTFRLYLLLVLGAYFILCWVKGGQTLPMKTWRLRLVSRDGGGVSLSLGVLRFVLALAGYGLAGISIVWVLFDRERQFLHDRLASTRIVRVP
jgi:uncharacterized RDD family membrane protein YckC